jgi:hypothetical protein
MVHQGQFGLPVQDCVTGLLGGFLGIKPGGWRLFFMEM